MSLVFNCSYFAGSRERSMQKYLNIMCNSLSFARRHFLERGLKVVTGALSLTVLPLSASASAEENRAPNSVSTFQVSSFLKFRSYRDSAGTVHTSKDYLPDEWFEVLGLSPVNVVYASRFLEGTGSSATLNAEKLQQIARTAPSHSWVSLDAEEWDTARFHPQVPTANGKSIVQNLIEVVQTFKAANSSVPVGLYSEVPQNTYGFTKTTKDVHDRLNPQYVKVAAAVDYYSPSLYNYNFDGTSAGDRQWAQAAEYAIEACRFLDKLNRTSKPILPYIMPVWTDSNKETRYLTETQLIFRLEKLKQLGANGCILWLSSMTKEPDGTVPLVLDPNEGWLRTAVEFAKRNRS